MKTTARRRKGLTEAQARTLVLSLPEATEGAHMGHPDFRVRKKIFASLSHDRRMMAMRVDPTALSMMVRADPDTFKDVWGGRWIGVRLARIGRKDLKALLMDAWRATAPTDLLP